MIFLPYLLLLLTAVSAQKQISTSSLLTCMANSQLTAQQFDVTFFPDNRTATFSIDGYTTLKDNIVVQVEVITYGLKAIQKTINLCSLNQPAICPMNAGRLSVQDQSYTLPEDIVKQIPSIAFTIPDLDASVRVIAYAIEDTTFSNPLACVQAQLSNGKTVQTKYASWPIAAISGVGVLTSAFVSVLGHSTTAAHIASNSISLFVYFQNLAITSMLGVDRVPPIAAAWCQNFQWSMGIMKVNWMQNAITWYIQATGGVPTVVVNNRDLLSISVQKKFKRGMDSLVKRAFPLVERGISIVSNADFNIAVNDTSIYNNNERNTTALTSKILILRGINRVAFLSRIELSNFFMTGVTFTLFVGFILIIALATFKGIVEMLTRTGAMTQTSRFFEYRKHWSSVIKGALFRMSIIAFPQLSILCIWEFTQRDSAATLVVAIVILAVICGLLFFGTLRVILAGRESIRMYKTPAYILYGDGVTLNKFGFLYMQFQADHYWWLQPYLVYSLLRSLFVATMQTKGKAQALIIFIIELVYFVALCWFKPYLDKRTNIFNIFIHFINTLNSLIFLFFSELFNQPPVVSSVLAIVLFVVNAVVALILMIFTIITCTMALVRREPDVGYGPVRDDRVSFIPKVADDGRANLELVDMGRTAMAGSNGVDLSKTSDSRVIFDTDSTSSDKPLQPTSAVLGQGAFSRPANSHNYNSNTGYTGNTSYGNDNYTNNGGYNSYQQNTGYNNAGGYNTRRDIL